MLIMWLCWCCKLKEPHGTVSPESVQVTCMHAITYSKILQIVTGEVII